MKQALPIAMDAALAVYNALSINGIDMDTVYASFNPDQSLMKLSIEFPNKRVWEKDFKGLQGTVEDNVLLWHQATMWHRFVSAVSPNELNKLPACDPVPLLAAIRGAQNAS